MKLLVTHIKQLVQVEENPAGKVAGAQMQKLNCIDNAWLSVENGKINDFGPMPPPKDYLDANGDKQIREIDASGRLVFPCWVDSHTHIVFASSREEEFVNRIRGFSYEEIAKKGGGILNSSAKMQRASADMLFDSAMSRLREMAATGTGSVEIKSGYGLTVESELKMLRVIKRLKENSQMRIKATFLGAHAIPAAFKEDRDKYIDLVINEMLPRVAEENLADYADVFCERGYFSKEETEKILNAASALGLKPKVHANQMSNSGGVQAGVACGAISVDHLEYIGQEEIKSLQETATMPVLLPGAAFFLHMRCAPARSLIEAGLPVAVATDYNPGSCPSGDMNFMVALLCIQYKMTPEEAILAATINGAYAMEISHEAGSIARGKRADFFITQPMPSYAYIPYAYTSNPVYKVFINGQEQDVQKQQ